jgi:hypothetical protein
MNETLQEAGGGADGCVKGSVQATREKKRNIRIGEK